MVLPKLAVASKELLVLTPVLYINPNQGILKEGNFQFTIFSNTGAGNE